MPERSLDPPDDHERECSECNGEGWVICGECDGKGCGECDNGKVVCSECDGQGLMYGKLSQREQDRLEGMREEADEAKADLRREREERK